MKDVGPSGRGQNDKDRTQRVPGSAYGRKWLPKKNRTRKLNESVVILRGPWRGPKPLSKRAQAKANKKEPGVRGERWRRLLEDGVYESRAALSRGEGVSRAAVTRALGIT